VKGGLELVIHGGSVVMHPDDMMLVGLSNGHLHVVLGMKIEYIRLVALGANM